MAVLIEKPDMARARPGTLINDDAQYDKMFSLGHDLGMYEICARLCLIVESFLRKRRKTVGAIYRNNLKFHLMMLISWQLAGVTNLTDKLISTLDTSILSEEKISDIFEWLCKVFDSKGASDSTAKDKEFVTFLKSEWPKRTHQ